MKLTGERPVEGTTPDSVLALHDAGYREVIARLGAGLVLDVGCGLGAETARLAGDNRCVRVDGDPGRRGRGRAARQAAAGVSRAPARKAERVVP